MVIGSRMCPYVLRGSIDDREVELAPEASGCEPNRGLLE